MLQILVCERAQVRVYSTSIHPASVCLHARTCVCVSGGWGWGGSLLRAVADVSVLNDHSACLA